MFCPALSCAESSIISYSLLSPWNTSRNLFMTRSQVFAWVVLVMMPEYIVELFSCFPEHTYVYMFSSGSVAGVN